MASFNYIDVPSCATRLQPSHSQANDIRPAPKIRTTFPHPEPDDSSSRSSSPITSPAKNAVFNILPSILLSSSMPPSGPIPNPRKAQRSQPPVPLLSAKDPLSIQITSVNFKRFVERVGPVFWLQDRVEEIIMWRCGWKLTTVWMAAYAFLCTTHTFAFCICAHRCFHRLFPSINSAPPAYHYCRYNPSNTAIPCTSATPQCSVAIRQSCAQRSDRCHRTCSRRISRLAGQYPGNSEPDGFLVCPYSSSRRL